jgi:hypothetical protein
VTCSTCRHFVRTLDGVREVGGGCHGPGAWIFSPKLNAWTRDRETFRRAALAVGLYGYAWHGRAVEPTDTCSNHETRMQAVRRGEPPEAVYLRRFFELKNRPARRRRGRYAA